MEQTLAKYLKVRSILKILTIFFLFSLFFPIRHVFFNSFAFKLGQYSDFSSFSLYLSDILLFLLAIVVFSSKASRFHVEKSLVFLIFWLIIIFLTHFSSNGWYYLAKWAEFIVAYATIQALFKDFGLKRLFLKTFVIFSTIQSIIALWQFHIQSYIGLNKLGEQILSPSTVGFSKIIVNGITYVRGYGTFPHPNLSSAYLVSAVLIILYQFSHETANIKKIAYSLALFVNILGLTATFSRAAFLATLLGAALFFGILIVKKQFTRLAKFSLVILAASMLASIIIFHPFLLSRATIFDSASLERVFYAKVGVRMLANHPFFGVGIGESVLHMQQYSPIHLDPWQIQPVHNYFLLAATELGLIGVLIIIWIFLSHLWQLIKKIKSEKNQSLVACHLSLVTILCAFIVLMMFDHYFYTLQQTQLLLWIFLGMIAAEVLPKGGTNEETKSR
jgi:O-antigen ligase